MDVSAIIFYINSSSFLNSYRYILNSDQFKNHYFHMSLLDNKDLFKIPDEPRPKTPTGPPQTFKWAIDLDL